ncbi:Fanconi anaemia protein FancD2 nuclease-domain-containing protein [Scenedesmus sp. NREL 46B-D3]|nr:Fanconi anaemia protein FancD2 nuclease-domain-containing protein [Scenedesmus sp. NREL 46B-D3]
MLLQVLTAVRGGLHFVNPSDPRMPVPDRKQKGVLQPASRSPEVLLVKELTAALQANEEVAAACLKLQAQLQAPAAHRGFDLLALLALHARGGASRKAVEQCLKRKLLDGHGNASWISRAREATLTAAAAQLYLDLFVGSAGTLERQQVLQALHGHLGSGVAGEQDAALQALANLAVSQRPLLAQYSSYLANVLDHLEGFSNSQLRQVFAMFAALTAVQPAAGSSSSSAAAAGGTRLQDELQITITKALSHSHPGYKRIGVVGSLALLKQQAAEHELLADSDGAAADRHKEAWMGRADNMFAQCQAHPGVLAFMMDQWAELLEQQGPAAAVAADGQQPQEGAAATPKPMLEWLSEKLQDLLNSMFFADYCQGMPDTQDEQQAGAHTPPQPDIQLDDSNIKGQLWFNLDSAFSPIYIQVLPLAASRDPLKRAAPAWMPSALRLLAAVLQQLSAGDLNNIDALLGCPLAMPAARMFTDGRWEGLPLPSKVCVLTSLLHAICWLREVVAVFAPGVGADVLGATAGTTSQAAVENLADTQNKLLMRLAQLRVLEALYQHLATNCPAAAQQLPDMACPLLLSTGRAAAAAALRKPPAAAGKAAAKQTEGPTFTPAEAMAKLRCLRLPASFALNTCLPPQMLLASLLPATHLAVDLQAKLKLLVTKARRPAGLMPPPAPAAAAAAAAGPGGLLGPVCMPAAGGVPACLQGVGLQELVQQQLPMLPALQMHLSTALSVIRQPPEPGREVLLEGLPGATSKVEDPVYQLMAVGAVVDALPAAHSLAMACMQTFTLLLGCHKELPEPLQLQVLAALAQQQRQQQQPADQASEELLQLLVASFKACRKHFCRASGGSSLQLELAVLSLLQAITTHPVAAASRYHGTMGQKLSAAADALLKESWQQEDEADEQSAKVFTWKGATVAITQLLTVLVSHAADPSQQVLGLVEVLGGVPDKVPAREQADPCGGYAALCSATMNTWYKVVFEQLVSYWETVVGDCQRLMPAAAGGRPGSRAQQQQQQNQMPDWESPQVVGPLGRAQACCQAFAGLVQLTKKHPARTGLLSCALKVGGQFVDVLLKGLAFWRALYASGQEQAFRSLIKEVQKGTKQLQTICNEAKARGTAPLLARAPAAKRSLERFLFEVKAFLYEAGQQELFYLGQLKHRDLEGNCVGSQLCEEQEEDEDEIDDEAGDYDAGHDDQEGSAAE